MDAGQRDPLGRMHRQHVLMRVVESAWKGLYNGGGGGEDRQMGRSERGSLYR